MVALTASAFNENRDRFLACGCDAFAHKPFRAEELFALLERRVGLRLIRAENTPVADDLVSAEELAARLAACPEGWRTALKGAVELGDFGRISALAAQLGDHDVRLGSVLETWAYNFDLDAFAVLIARGVDANSLPNSGGLE